MNLTTKIMRILNVFENDSGSPETDYKTLYLYHDGPDKKKQVTLGRGFTQFGGALRKVIDRYAEKGGAHAAILQSKYPKFASTALAADQEFLMNLKDAGDEQVMKDAQDEIYEEVYLRPAMQWADDHGFVLGLSKAVIADSYLHSGSMYAGKPKLMDRFPEKKPSSGGSEKDWIFAYLRVRYDWLYNASEILRNTVYRPKFFMRQAGFVLDRGDWIMVGPENWNMDCPIVCRGATIC
jgi:chitosanase